MTMGNFMFLYFDNCPAFYYLCQKKQLEERKNVRKRNIYGTPFQVEKIGRRGLVAFPGER